jgi:glycosyltransferase involved in cell wall biosynthesis
VKLLLLTDWSYPCDHRFLTNVYARRFSTKHDIVWVMRPGEDGGDELREHEWEGDPVYELPADAYSPPRTLGTILTGRLRSHALFDILDVPSEIDLVHVRNDLAMALLATRLRTNFDVPYVHQISHLKAESLLHLAKVNDTDSRVSDAVKGVLGKWVRRYVSGQADVVLPISTAMETTLEEMGYDVPMQPLPTGADTTIDPDSIDPAPFVEEYDVPADRDVLVYIGTMRPIRQLDFLFEVLATFDGQRPFLLMVGGRDPENQRRLAAQAEHRGVREDVRFTGWISDDDTLYRAIRAADVGVSPLPPTDVLETNAPIKVLEYLAMKTPVVATDTPDQRRVLKRSGGGTVTDYDPESFARAIDEIISSGRTRLEMGESGREYIIENRNFDVLHAKVVDVYREVLDSDR